MDSSMTDGTALLQQGLTHPVEECLSGAQPEDLMERRHEGANFSDCRMPTGNNEDYSVNAGPKKLTKLDMLNIFLENAHLNGPKHGPFNIAIEKQTSIVLNALYPKGVPTNINVQSLKKSIEKFLSSCKKRYIDCERNLQFFRKKNKKWLNTFFDIQVPRLEVQKKPILQQVSETLSVEKNNNPLTCSLRTASFSSQERHPGIESSVIEQEQSSFNILPTSSTYENQSDLQMRRAHKSLENLLQDELPSQIIKAVSKDVTNEKTGEKLDRSSAQKFESVLNECPKSPTRSKEVAASIKLKPEPKPYTPDEALSLFIDKKFTVDYYIYIQKNLEDRGFPAYPSINKVNAAKKMCYPEDITVTNRDARVSFQSLLLHTYRRIIKCCDDTVSEYCRQKQKDTVHCTFEGVWGLDSTENHIFTTAYMPLYLKASDGFVLWSNPSPQSFRLCRPLRIQNRPVTDELILNEKMQVEYEIKHLTSLYAETSSGKSVIGVCKLHLTIIDSKIFNIITGANSQPCCPHCGAIATEFNKLNDVIKKPVKLKTLCYGFNLSQAWIRIVEFLLHLGYKNDPAVMMWRVTTGSPEDRIVRERKWRIKNEIRNKMSCSVDVKRQTARTVLSDQHRKTFADILGIGAWLVDDLHTILVALSCGLKINAEKFETFCQSVARKYIQEYNWFYMSVTLHRILIHGGQIIKSSSSIIGMLSQQVSKFRNKYWYYGLKDTTNISKCIHNALEASDPYISSFSMTESQNKRNPLPIPNKVLALLNVTTDNVNYNSKDDVALTSDRNNN